MEFNTPADLSEEEKYPLLLLETVLSYVHGYVMIAAHVTGICGNVFSVVIFWRCRKRNDATIHYLSALAVSDTFCIIFVGITTWLHNGIGSITGYGQQFDIMIYSEALCKSIRYTGSVAILLSGWLIVAFSIERVVIVWFPLSRARITKSKRILVILILFVVASTGNIQFAVFSTIFNQFGSVNCFIPMQPLLQRQLIIHVNNVLYIYLPTITIFGANIAILIGIARSLRQMAGSSTMSQTDRQETKVALSLFFVSTVYVVLLVPGSAVWAYRETVTDLIYGRMLTYVAKFGDQLHMLNYCINFIIYGCSLPFYQRESRIIFGVLCTKGGWRK
jgi:hypothetical protein